MEFEHCPSLPTMTTKDKQWGYTGCALFYGFGDDGKGNADAVLSGKNETCLSWPCLLHQQHRPVLAQLEHLLGDAAKEKFLDPGKPPPTKYDQVNIQTLCF